MNGVYQAVRENKEMNEMPSEQARQSHQKWDMIFLHLFFSLSLSLSRSPKLRWIFSLFRHTRYDKSASPQAILQKSIPLTR